MDVYSCWRVPREVELLWEKWPKDALVFNTLSGETHHLNDTAATALEELERAPQSTKTLMDTLAEKFESEDAEGFMHQIQQLLKEFDRLGLVEPSA